MDSAEIHGLAIKLAEAVFTEIETSRSILKDAITECLRRELLASGMGEARRAEPALPAPPAELQSIPDKELQKKLDRLAAALNGGIIDDPTALSPRDVLAKWFQESRSRLSKPVMFPTDKALRDEFDCTAYRLSRKRGIAEGAGG